MSGISPEHIRDGILYLIALILSICVHEFGHAFIADKLGDPLPRSEGRVTLNPLAHIDPIGTIAMPLLAFITSITHPAIGSRIIGWGRPVRVTVSSRKMKGGLSFKTGHMLIALAGPFMNIGFALVLSAIVVGMLRGGVTGDLPDVVFNMVSMNIVLAFFNLIPCPPLDGGAVLRGVLPRRLEYIADFLDQYGSFLLLGLLVSGMLSKVLMPAREVALYWATVLIRLAS